MYIPGIVLRPNKLLTFYQSEACQRGALDDRTHDLIVERQSLGPKTKELGRALDLGGALRQVSAISLKIKKLQVMQHGGITYVILDHHVLACFTFLSQIWLGKADVGCRVGCLTAVRIPFEGMLLT